MNGNQGAGQVNPEGALLLTRLRLQGNLIYPRLIKWWNTLARTRHLHNVVTC